MSEKSKILRVVERLGGVSPRAAGLVISVRESLKHRGVRRVWTDADGDWSYASGSTTLVSPFLTLEPPEHHIARAAHHWEGCRRPPIGGTVIDVGAGLGEDALLFASWVGPGGKVIAIEADPSISRCLGKTVSRSAAHAVLPLHLAVGEREGTTRINADQQFLARRTDVGSGVEVKLTTLDALSRERRLGRVDLLKMNIEGAEVPALEGARELLARTSAVVISCHDFIANRGGDESMRTKARVQQALRRAGFQVTDRPSRGADWLDDIVLADRLMS